MHIDVRTRPTAGILNNGSESAHTSDQSDSGCRVVWFAGRSPTAPRRGGLGEMGVCASRSTPPGGEGGSDGGPTSSAGGGIVIFNESTVFSSVMMTELSMQGRPGQERLQVSE